MATSKLNLTRDQLATFLKDHEQIKQFERLFATVDAIAPDFVNEVFIAAGSAQATANEALALIAAIENSLAVDGAVTDAKATLALQELQALKEEFHLKTLEPAQEHNNSIVTDYITINQNGRGENAVGRMLWDDGEGTIDVGLKGGNVNCKLGEQEYARAYNDTLSTMTKGQVVYISGAQGNRVAVKLAQADSDANSAHTIGIVAETIAAGGAGWVQVSGPIYKVNTFGTIAGDTVYLSPTTPGAWTTVKPLAPQHLVIVGFIERVSATVGSIFIKVDNGYELEELHNVRITSVQPDDLLQYDSGGPYWKNVAPSTISIGTATNLAGGAAGSVPYQTAASTTTFLPIGTALQVLKVNAGATAPEWISGAALSKTDDTNVTLTLGGSPTTALLAATSLTLGWTGQLSLARGGTNANITASAGSVAYSTATALALNTAGSSGDWLKSAGTSAPTWTAPAALTKTDDTNVTLTLGGSPTTALLNAASLTLGWTGTLAVSRGGTGTGTAFTAGSVVFAGASGTYAQDNANLFWDDSNNRLGIGTATPASTLDVSGSFNLTGNAVLGDATTDTVRVNGTMGVSGAPISGATLSVGTTGSVGSTTPARLSLGGTYSTAAGANPKLAVYDDGVGLYGFGVSSAQMDFIIPSATRYVWYIGGSEQARISAAGNFLVGTTTALTSGVERMTIAGATVTDVSGAYPVTAVFADTRAYNSTAPAAGGGIGFGFKYNAAGALTVGSSIQGYKENTTDGDFGAGLRLLTRTNGGQPAERMRIDSAGNLALGATSASFRLDVTSANATGTVAAFRTTAATTSLIAFSDNTPTNVGPRLGSVGNNLVFLTNSTGSAAERMRIDAAGNVIVTGVGGIGYGTGSGGAVTQATSRTTGVTLDKTNGAITLVSAAGTATWQTFTVTNNKVAATDTVIVNQKSGTDLYQIFVTNVAAGSFNITFATTGGTTTEQPVFNFAVIKAVTA